MLWVARIPGVGTRCSACTYNAGFHRDVERLNGHLLSVRDLACNAGGRRLFQGIDFDLGRGELMEIRGPNGSGKTTLLRCIAGLFTEESGRVDVAADERLYLGHKPGLSPLLTPLENLRWYLALQGREHRREDCLSALREVGLNGSHLVPCRSLSAGQQRRAALARLTASSAPLWLLDEPFAALDESGRDIVRSLVRTQCSGGGAVVCATHQGLGIVGARRLELAA